MAFSEILGRLADPPFTFQLNHEEQRRHWIGLAQSLPPTDSPASMQDARKGCEEALAACPEDACCSSKWRS